MKKSARPSNVFFAILTDELENASKDFSRDKIFKMIETQREKHGWQFIFLAANQDAVEAGARIAIRAQDSIAFKATKAGIKEACRDLSMATMDRRKK